MINLKVRYRLMKRARERIIENYLIKVLFVRSYFTMVVFPRPLLMAVTPRMVFCGWGPHLTSHITLDPGPEPVTSCEPDTGRLTGTRRLFSPVLALVGAPRTLKRAQKHVVSSRHQVIDRRQCEDPCKVSAAK